MSLEISRILHAGYIFKTANTQIVFDPIFENPFSVNCYAYPEISFDTEKIKTLKFDAVFISHFHEDHCSFESLNLIDRNTSIYMYCIHEEMFSLLKKLGFRNVYSLKLNSSIHIKDIEIIPRQALDHDIDCLFQIKTDDLNILNVVDSWIDDETLSLLCNEPPWDLICWPFQTMSEVEVLSPKLIQSIRQDIPQEWLNQLQQLKPKIVIPSSCQFKLESWSWYNKVFFPISYKEFSTAVKTILPNTQIQRLNPGQTIYLSSESIRLTKPLPWIKPNGDQNVDYIYDATVIPQNTADIAKHFTSLTESEKKRVQHYCEKEILNIYKIIGPSTERFFLKSRVWKLSVFDHNGRVKNYFYTVYEDNLSLLEKETSFPDWTTEIVEQKLFSTLELGESLTSLYLRVSSLDDNIDILEDPLIRCLSYDSFANYQKAQLAKLIGQLEMT